MSGDEVRVVAESLIEASRAVTAVVDAVPGRYIEGLASVHTGHPRLQTVLGDFTARWQEGVDAVSYTHLDVYKRQEYRRARHGAEFAWS